VKWLEYTPFTRSTPLHARYTTTCFADASRNGEPFDALVKNRKRLPNPLMRICTQELKIRPMREYMKAHGFKHWNMIVGLRADEPHRVARMEALNEQAKERWQTVMPLAKTGVAEKDVLSFWKAQDFDLKLKTWEGNCDLCFLKARDKKVRIMQERPDLAAWWLAKEKQIGQPFRKSGLDYAGLVDRAKKMLPVIQPIEGALDDDLGDCFCTS
jgi:3'-phosphoadenosine 5'-phosphosulfate sulfotransferase (PAPS reductase)/FAD synthetase